MKYAAIDFETAYWGPGSACSLGISVSDGNEITEEWYRLIRPYRMNFDPICMRVNGIYPDDVEKEPAFPAFWKEVAERLEGSIVFAHNARFDMGVLASVLDVYDLPDIHFLYGDTVAVSRMLWKKLPNHKLDTVAGSLGYDFNHHQALDDARACEHEGEAHGAQRRVADGQHVRIGVEQAEQNLPLKKFAVKRTHVPGSTGLTAPVLWRSKAR